MNPTALKSQLEARLSKLEKENKELRASAGSGGDGSVAGTSEMAIANANLQEENTRLKKDLEMQRQRVLALEKQVKLHTQQQGSKGASGGADKPQNDPPKANIKPIAGTSSSTMTKQVTQAAGPPQARPLTASIRPMSMQVRKLNVVLKLSVEHAVNGNFIITEKGNCDAYYCGTNAGTTTFASQSVAATVGFWRDSHAFHRSC